MRALVQRVSEASVSVDDRVTGAIGSGLCVFVGVKSDDTAAHAAQLAEKVMKLRVFPDGQGIMNLNVQQHGGALLIVSQFTLYGDTRRGNRPSYSEAAKPETARLLYEEFVERCRSRSIQVETGIFQAHMEVRIVNDGPVTLLCFSGE